jgi:hypothetical protein
MEENCTELSPSIRMQWLDSKVDCHFTGQQNNQPDRSLLMPEVASTCLVSFRSSGASLSDDDDVDEDDDDEEEDDEDDESLGSRLIFAGASLLGTFSL